MGRQLNGLHKWKLIYRQGPWSGLDDVEFATMSYLDWFNNAGPTAPSPRDPATPRPLVRGRLIDIFGNDTSKICTVKVG